MAIPQPIFLNSFQKGSSENSNIGTGTFLGVETYSKKGVARLTKDTLKTSGSVVTDLPIFFCNHTETAIFSQGDTGKVYSSTDSGTTWIDISPLADVGASHGKGLIFYDDVLYEFINGKIKYLKTPFAGGAAWVDWKSGLSGTFNTPFIYPSAYGFYFCNNNLIGLVQEATPGILIDPATPGTYNYSDFIFTLPSIYQTTTLSFLPPNQLMIGTTSSGVGNDTQIADLIGWDTISKSKFTPPLRLYSNAGVGQTGITQLINRNNVLYAVTGGNHAIFQTNGATFNQIAEMSLRTNYRKTTGEQATASVFLNSYPQAVAMLGNKMLTGVSTSDVDNKPDNSYALAPLGIWSIAFPGSSLEDMAIQCEFTISSGVVRANTYSIGAIHTISQGRILIGWYDGTNYGIDQSQLAMYQVDGTQVSVESPMMEIGTALIPTPSFQSIELNFVRNIIAGQSVSVYGRTAFDQPYTLLQPAFTTTNLSTSELNSMKVVQNPLGNSQYLQIFISMNTGSPNTAWSPELRSVKIS